MYRQHPHDALVMVMMGGGFNLRKAGARTLKAQNRGCWFAPVGSQLPYGQVAPINLPTIYGAKVVISTAFLFCLMAQLRAEEKEPFAVVESGAATERSIQEGTYSVGPSASVEFLVIKDWLEIETGISPLFRTGQTEWQADLLFKKPFTINEHVEFMIGAGPQLSYATAGGGTQIASEIAIERMIWPSANRKFGWFVEPTYGYSFSRGHEQLAMSFPFRQFPASK
jgi:hypothetical protein